MSHDRLGASRPDRRQLVTAGRVPSVHNLFSDLKWQGKPQPKLFHRRLLSDRRSSSHLETDALSFLEIRNNLKEIVGGRISLGSKHLMKRFDVHLGMFRQLREANRRIDVIAQQLFSERDFPGEKGFEGIA